MLLSDKEIVEAIVRKQLSIEPFNRKNLTPNGYDLTVDEIMIPKTGEKINREKIKIPAMTHFLVSTLEYVKLMGVSGSLWIRTSFARKGIIGSFGKVDVGFEGNLTLSAFNAGNEIELGIGDRFAQIVFERITKPEMLYFQRSGNYMGQRGVTL
ncbi:MAG: dCTP deaminase [Thermoplasmatales archaeon]|nr:dCTP deaminase [Thermoplasmatales archaeon]